ncbi:MAG: hypothetical protein WDZ30_10700 [Cellvibrionaceae bacterium]
MYKRSLAAALALLFATSLSVADNDCGLANLDPIALDKNGNAELSRDEAQGSALAWAFDQVDTNNDGVISQPEFGARCASYKAGASGSNNQTNAKPREPTAAEKAAAEKAERQKARQSRKVEGRVDEETDEAVDSAIDKGLDRLFGR